MRYPIHDLFIRQLEPEQQGELRVLPLLRYSDHLLRRFGLAELHRLAQQAARPMQLRPAADELWALVQGSVRFTWRDERASSPTRGADYELTCDQPTLVLAPFGVAFGFQALEGPAELVRLATHERDPEQA